MNIDPMQAFIAGYLLACILPQNQDVFKLVRAKPGKLAPTGFEMELASGLRLAVKVDVLEESVVGG